MGIKKVTKEVRELIEQIAERDKRIEAQAELITAKTAEAARWHQKAFIKQNFINFLLRDQVKGELSEKGKEEEIWAQMKKELKEQDSGKGKKTDDIT